MEWALVGSMDRGGKDTRRPNLTAKYADIILTVRAGAFSSTEGVRPRSFFIMLQYAIRQSVGVRASRLFPYGSSGLSVHTQHTQHMPI